MVISIRNHHEVLHPLWPYRNDQPPAGSELTQQLLRDFVRGRSDDDAVLGSVLGPALPTVAGFELHIVDIQVPQSLFGLAQ